MKRSESRRSSRLSSLPSTVADLFAGAVIISALLFSLADSVYLATCYIPGLVRSTLQKREYVDPGDEQLLESNRRTIYLVRRNDALLDNDFGYGSNR